MPLAYVSVELSQVNKPQSSWLNSSAIFHYQFDALLARDDGRFLKSSREITPWCLKRGNRKEGEERQQGGRGGESTNWKAGLAVRTGAVKQRGHMAAFDGYVRAWHNSNPSSATENLVFPCADTKRRSRDARPAFPSNLLP